MKIAGILFGIVVAVCLLSACGPKTWEPIDDNFNNWPFYTPVVEDIYSPDGTLLQRKDGLVEIFECTSRQARIWVDIWVSRSALQIDWCNHWIAVWGGAFKYERVKP